VVSHKSRKNTFLYTPVRIMSPPSFPSPVFPISDSKEGKMKKGITILIIEMNLKHTE